MAYNLTLHSVINIFFIFLFPLHSGIQSPPAACGEAGNEGNEWQYNNSAIIQVNKINPLPHSTPIESCVPESLEALARGSGIPSQPDKLIPDSTGLDSGIKELITLMNLFYTLLFLFLFCIFCI
jgi:hypothetical protein